MQPEAHSIENIKTSREVWFYWVTCKRAMNARPRTVVSVSRRNRDPDQDGRLPAAQGICAVSC